MLASYTNEDEIIDFHVEEELLTEIDSNSIVDCIPCFWLHIFLDLEEEQILKSLDQMEIIDNIEDQGLIYIAGYV